MPADRDAPLRVLCLEPDRDLRDLYALLLAREGVAIVGVADPLAPTRGELAGAIGMLLDPFPIWDDFLPMLRAIRADPAARHLPILVISADAGRLAACAADLAGLDCQVLAKPFDLDAFDGWVRRIVHSARLNVA